MSDEELGGRVMEVTQVIGYRALCISCAWIHGDSFSYEKTAQSAVDEHNRKHHG